MVVSKGEEDALQRTLDYRKHWERMSTMDHHFNVPPHFALIGSWSVSFTVRALQEVLDCRTLTKSAHIISMKPVRLIIIQKYKSFERTMLTSITCSIDVHLNLCSKGEHRKM